jgi:hypothetical protein
MSKVNFNIPFFKSKPIKGSFLSIIASLNHCCLLTFRKFHKFCGKNNNLKNGFNSAFLALLIHNLAVNHLHAVG